MARRMQPRRSMIDLLSGAISGIIVGVFFVLYSRITYLAGITAGRRR